MSDKKHQTFIIIPPRSSRIKALRIRIAFVLVLLSLIVIGFAGYFIPFNSFALDVVEENQKRNLAAQNVKLLQRIRSIRLSLSRLRKEIENIEVRKADILSLSRTTKKYDSLDSEKRVNNKNPGPDNVFDYIKKSERSIIHFANRAIDDPRFLARIPVAKPLAGPAHYGMKYGKTRDPFTNDEKMHNGLDFIAENGTPVRATASGIVSKTENHRAWGLRVIIKHDFGFSTVYAHLETINTVRGRRVEKNDIIGTVGNSGISVGPHLHYEIRRNGIPLDPEKYIFPVFSDSSAVELAASKE
ncbi:MAG: peptidoglycan DD-metalloendopeptidase family protein [Chitinivibrionales bacterium]|nr:peptidoglycan DD-metalloendopeptidase family protein [Chitinivibrionales bacterium]